MNSKAGQVTIFILTGVAISIMFLFIFYLQRNVAANTEIENLKSFESVKSFVNSCMEDIGDRGIYFIGLHGGHYYNYTIDEEDPIINIPYYWYNQQNLMPSKETIQDELSKYVEQELQDCLDFNVFSGYNISTGNIEANSIITNNNIKINVDFPIEAVRGEEIFKADKFLSTVNLDFDYKYEIIKKIMEEQEKAPNSVPIGFLSELAYNEGFTFTNVYLNNNSVLYTLIFEEELKPSYIYNFIGMYNWSSTA
jgi:hypothetical protein